MKRFKSEFVHSYGTYSFGYSEYAEYENGDAIADIYASGFLPYSGTNKIQQTLYMARSARINLKTFDLNSENRRIARRFDGHFTRTVTPIKKYDYTNPDLLTFCLRYFSKRHGPKVLPKERLLTILDSGFPLFLVTYTDKSNVVVGYALEIADETMGHYWFSFYDLEYAYKSLGMWIMLDCIREAQKAGKKHYYIGTVYGEKALYKTNFDSLEFWNGNAWVQNTKLLRAKSRADHHRSVDVSDDWKEEHGLF